MITEYFLTFPIFSCGKMGKNVPNGKVFFQIEHFFTNLEKYFSKYIQQFKGTMKFKIRAIYWGWEKIGNT